MRGQQRGFARGPAKGRVRMEERLASQVKRIYHDTKQAISECTFIGRQQLEQLMLRPSEEELIRGVDGSQGSLIEAASLLRELHTRFLRFFVLSAFDLTWDMMTTPRRFEYIKQKELELYNSLMSIANLKQDEIRAMIRDTMSALKRELSTGSLLTQSSPTRTTTTPTTCTTATATTTTNTCTATSTAGSQCGGGGDGGAHEYCCSLSAATSSSLASSMSLGAASGSELHKGELLCDGEEEEEEEAGYCCNSLDTASGSAGSARNLSHAHSLENISSRSELQLYRQEIQEFVLQQLNESIASKLVGSVDSLRKSYIGTLERCLESLEQQHHQQGQQAREFRDSSPQQASLAFRQILNAAYRVEVSLHSSTSVVRVLWDKMKQLVSASLLPRWSLNWYSSTGGCIIDEHWRRQQALDILNELSDSRLAKSICLQFRQRLKASHDQFQLSIRQLEYQHADRLEHTEELRLRVRKLHAPRMAKFVLESTSLIDLILHGMPQLEKEIGRGQYGVVYACDSWAGRLDCAVKSVVPPDDKYWNELAMEFYYTRCIPEHERVVNIYGSVIDHSYGSGSTPAVLLIMERLSKDLYSAIKSGLDWLSRLQVAIDVVEGIRFLHNQGLVHRDIKLKNILLDSNNRAKITDLGFCKPEAMMSGSVVGTPIHMSPELFSGRYDNSVDVYAFGILFWYICAGHVRVPIIFALCQTRDQLWNCVRRGVRPERLPQFDNECWQLMVQCWDGDRTKRPHLGDVEIKLRQIHAHYT